LLPIFWILYCVLGNMCASTSDVTVGTVQVKLAEHDPNECHITGARNTERKQLLERPDRGDREVSRTTVRYCQTCVSIRVAVPTVGWPQPQLQLLPMSSPYTVKTQGRVRKYHQTCRTSLSSSSVVGYRPISKEGVGNVCHVG
jgi:hypothetical protein